MLKTSYNGSLTTVEKAVRGRFMQETVHCPVVGEIGAHICLGHQKRAAVFTSGSSVRVAIARACRNGCPHSRISRSSEPDGVEERDDDL